MNRYAASSLLRARGRLSLAIGGVALAFALMLALDAIVTGTEARITAYIDHSEADVWVAQAGVRTMHMSASALPIAVAGEVRAVPGVASVTPIIVVSSVVVLSDERANAYIIGLPPDATSGTLWDVEQGAATPPPGGAVVDRGVALEAGVRRGDVITILGAPFTVTGLSNGTANPVSSVVVVPLADIERLRGGAGTASYLLVRGEPGVDAAGELGCVTERVPGVTAQTRREFARQEQQLVRDMSTDLVSIMNAIGFAIGLAVMSLTSYTAVLARRREFGVLKALGVRNSRLYQAVIAQSLLCVGIGLVAGLGFTLVVAEAAPALGSNLALAVSWVSLLRVAGTGLVLVGLSAALPVRQLAALDPAAVFRRAS